MFENKITRALGTVNYKLLVAIFATMFLPTIYQTVRVFFLGSMPDDWGFSIASQLSWVNLCYEIIQEGLILPLFFLLGKSLNNKQEFENKFEELSREVVNLTLHDLNPMAQKVFKETDGAFTVWVVYEANKSTVLTALNNKISSDAKLQLDYDKMKFEQIFNQEMEKLSNGQ